MKYTIAFVGEGSTEYVHKVGPLADGKFYYTLEDIPMSSFEKNEIGEAITNFINGSGNFISCVDIRIRPVRR